MKDLNKNAACRNIKIRISQEAIHAHHFATTTATSPSLPPPPAVRAIMHLA
jgi:hypothetical protein